MPPNVKRGVVTTGKTESARVFSNKLKHSSAEDSPMATTLAPHKKARDKGNANESYRLNSKGILPYPIQDPTPKP